MENNGTREFVAFISIIAAASLVFLFMLFGLVGMKVAFGILIVSFPFYLILNNFRLDSGEKFVFSLLLGMTIFPSLVYILGFMISFKISIFMVFAFLTGASFLIRYYATRKHISS